MKCMPVYAQLDKLGQLSQYSDGAMGWMTSVQFLVEAVLFLFTTVSRSALGPTQLHIQCVLGALSLGG